MNQMDVFFQQVPDQLKTPFMILWANNGDIISKQYAGTNALKVCNQYTYYLFFEMNECFEIIHFVAVSSVTISSV